MISCYSAKIVLAHVPEEEWIRVPGTHEAIISKDMFEKAKKIRADGFYYGEAAGIGRKNIGI